jgi:hypothetical protein
MYCGVDDSRSRTGFYLVDTPKCSAGLCSVDQSRISTGFCFQRSPDAAQTPVAYTHPDVAVASVV